MGEAVDAFCQPGDDRYSRRGELRRDSAGRLPAVRRRSPGADDRNRRFVLRWQEPRK